MSKRTRSDILSLPEKKLHVNRLEGCPEKYLGCSKNSDPYRMMESRFACMWYYLSELYGTHNIFSGILTLPFICSFIESREIIENYILQGLYVMFPDKHKTKFFRELKKSLLFLVNCNIEWNNKMEARIYESMLVKLQPKFLFAERDFKSTAQALDFLAEILGVIGKDSFVSKSETEFYYDKGMIKKIEKSLDKYCSELNNNVCETNDCSLRKSSKGDYQCVNKQRLRRIRAGDKNSYYLLEDDKVPTAVYFPLCLYKIIGICGVFMYQNIEELKIQNVRKFIFTFPPFNEPDAKQDSVNYGKYTTQLTFYTQSFYMWYSHAYIKDVETYDGKSVGIHIGMFRYIQNWYRECIEPLNLQKNADITIVGTSLGGALTNVATFYMLNSGFTNIHMYACGSPRIGNKSLKEWMTNMYNRNLLKEDSANYVRFMNVVKDGKFYTQFDPITKSPPNSASLWTNIPVVGGNLRWTDNFLIKIVNGSFKFNPVFQTFDSQGHYDVIWPSKTPLPIGTDCENYYKYIHSVAAYSSDVLQGALQNESDNEQPEYHEYYDQIVNLDEKEC